MSYTQPATEQVEKARQASLADFLSQKAVTDISEVKAKDGKLYVSAIFDCFDLMPLGLSIEDNMCASLCCHTLENAKKAYPDIKNLSSQDIARVLSADFADDCVKFS